MKTKNDLLQQIRENLDLTSIEKEILVLFTNTSKNRTMGFEVTQTSNTTLYMSEKENFCQTISSSSFLHMAERVYDDTKKILLYKGKDEEDLLKKEHSILSYDDYIRNYGKLIKKRYPVHREVLKKGEYLHETYVEEEREDTPIVSNLLIQEINESSVLSILEVEENHYRLKLKPIFSDLYFALQIKNEGGFDTYPDIQSSELELFFNEKHLLERAVSRETFKAKTGFLHLQVEQETIGDYYLGENHHFLIHGKEQEFQIPESNEKLIDLIQN